MKKRICKVIFSTSQEPESRNEIVGEINEKQIISAASEWVVVTTKYLSENKIQEAQSIIHKSDIHNIQFFNQGPPYSFDKTDLGLTSQIPNLNSMEA